ncbi:MAG: hypothetical protein JWR05_3520 [Mucilaginibacter sp.]|nr:hypothetical protein [Mucilaginibacter sp.]
MQTYAGSNPASTTVLNNKLITNKLNMTDSSKIKKTVKSITFSGKWTTIKFGQTFQPRDQNDVVDEQPTFKSNMSRHPDFDRAMRRMCVHAICRAIPFAKPEDKVGKLIDRDYFDNHLYEDDPKFMDMEVTGIIVTTKKDLSGFQILGKVESVDGQITKIKSPVISLLKIDGAYNYPLLDLAQDHLDAVELEALEFLKYKSNSPQLKLSLSQIDDHAA